MQRPTPSIEPARGSAQRLSAAAPSEIRELVYELKFYIPGHQADGLLQWARARLQPDPHGGGPHGDSYQVSSVYFDTTAYHVLGRQGSYARSKYRIRRYNQSDTVYLERKTRGASRVIKRRSPTTLDSLQRLLSSQASPDWGGHWFHRRLLVRSLRVVSRVDYQRVARIGTSDYGPVRLTLDRSLRAWHARELSFNASGSGAALSGEQLILELKFGNVMPAVFKELIREFGPRASGISKYRLACCELGLQRSGAALQAAAAHWRSAAPVISSAAAAAASVGAVASLPSALAGAVGGVTTEPVLMRHRTL